MMGSHGGVPRWGPMVQPDGDPDGGGGVDILSGGQRRDVFHCGAWWDHSPVGQYDVIKDFSFRDSDKIRFYRNRDLKCRPNL